MDDFGRSSTEFEQDVLTADEQEFNEERARVQESYPILEDTIQILKDALREAEVDAAKSMNIGMSEQELKAILSGTERFKKLLSTLTSNLEGLADTHTKRG